MRIAVRPCHTVGPRTSKCRPAWMAAITRCVSRGVAERHQHLVEHHVVEDLEAGGRERSAKRAAPAAGALDEVRQAARGRATAAPPTPRRRARGATARACSPTDRDARLGGQVVGRDRHRGAQRVRVAHEREPAVVGHVEPLVRVGGPGVGVRRCPSTRCARAGAAAAHRPNAPSTCTQAPAACARCARSRRTGSNAPVFTLPACTQTIAGPDSAGSAIGAHAALAVDRHAAARGCGRSRAGRAT